MKLKNILSLVICTILIVLSIVLVVAFVSGGSSKETYQFLQHPFIQSLWQ